MTPFPRLPSPFRLIVWFTLIAAVIGALYTITYGNGNGDFVELTTRDPSAEADALIAGSAAAAAAAAATFTDVTNINFSNNTIKFGDGAGDYVFAIGSSSNNKITMGNGTGDSVTLSRY